jgi:hypothetical protein
VEHGQGQIALRQDTEATKTARGFLRPILLRLMYRAAADLLDSSDALSGLETGDAIHREGDILTVDVARYPPFAELMARELRLPGGVTLLPFRALAVDDVTVKEGELVIHTRLDRDLVSVRKGHDWADDEPVEIQIVESEEPTT